MIGSNLNWWKSDNTCQFHPQQNVWSCPWSFKSWNVNNPQNTRDKMVVSVFVNIPGLMDGCNKTISPTCNDQYSNYSVGRVSKWGSDAATSYVDLSPFVSTMSGVTGPSNTGWYWRPKSALLGIDGAPSYFVIKNSYQMVKTTFVVLAIAYPAGTQFTIQQNLYGNNPLPVTPMALSLSVVLKQNETVNDPSQFDCTGIKWYENCKNTGGGFSWYFDGSYLYLRIVPFGCYNYNTKSTCVNNADSFNAYGAKVGKINSNIKLTVSAVCQGCAIQKSYNGINYYQVADAAPSFLLEGSLTFPTYQPSPSPVPSYNPSKTPTYSPSSKPTLVPSFKPSKTPTYSPSCKPTFVPSFKPSMTPSLSPSCKPTFSPSFKPSMTPSLSPSCKPTFSPSFKPSMTPLRSPSMTPTFSPSFKPSMTPLRSPSMTPTVPKLKPSYKPT